MSESEPLEGRLGIGEIARRAGVSVDTVRHYEGLGLLGAAERTAAGYRKFPAGAARQIGEIRAALDLGFGLAELVVAVKARERGNAPCRSVRDLLAAKKTEIDREIAELKKRRARIVETLVSWETKLAGAPEDCQVGLLFGHGGSAPTRKTAGRLSAGVRQPRSQRSKR